jgi:uncharacterized protein (TIGR00255 family)
MISSMTAYAAAEEATDQVAITVELRAVNSRHLDVVVRLPGRLACLEDRVKSTISGRVNRGRVDTHIRVHDFGDAAAAFEVDTARAGALLEALDALKQSFGLAGTPSLDLLAGTPGIIKPAEVPVESEPFWPVMEACLERALDDLAAMRRQEGAFLETDINKRLDAIAGRLDRIDRDASDLLPVYQQRLTERIQTLTGGAVDIDPARIAQEAAFLADRSDICEEVVRARSHLVQWRQLMAGDAPAGRKLNFLIQELNREFNTMGAKVGKADLAHVIVDVKADLEKLREQVQNIE